MSSPLRILILEDFEEDADLLQINLRRQGVLYESVVVDNRTDYVDQLAAFRPDIVLSDHLLPQFDSTEALRLCREKIPDMPFILVTGTVSEEFAVLCLKQGADDYILKSNLARLSSAIYNALNQREEERKRKEAEESLKNRNIELLKINGELDSFVYRVSHNLRAPLTSVLGLIQLSRMPGTSNEEIGKYLNLMENSIMKLDGTLKGILDYSQNTRRKKEFSRIDIKKLVADSINNFRYMAGFETINIIRSISADAPLYSDPLRLTFVFDNLISNAIKFANHSPGHYPFVKIQVSVTPSQLLIAIEDNGVGIEVSYLNKVFDMFFKTSEVGAGLGLYIVKETVDKLDGSVVLKSERGKGTTVKVQVPNRAPE